jgi:hypothetical protein
MYASKDITLIRQIHKLVIAYRTLRDNNYPERANAMRSEIHRLEADYLNHVIYPEPDLTTKAIRGTIDLKHSDESRITIALYFRDEKAGFHASNFATVKPLFDGISVKVSGPCRPVLRRALQRYLKTLLQHDLGLLRLNSLASGVAS